MSLELLAIGFLTWMLWFIALFIFGIGLGVIQHIFGIKDPKRKIARSVGMLLGTVVFITLLGIVNPLGMSFGL